MKTKVIDGRDHRVCDFCEKPFNIDDPIVQCVSGRVTRLQDYGYGTIEAEVIYNSIENINLHKQCFKQQNGVIPLEDMKKGCVDASIKDQQELYEFLHYTCGRRL